MLKSFIYMFEDKSFWKKYCSLFAVILAANLLINWSSTFSPSLNEGATSVWYYILFFVGFFIMLIPYGYSISALKAKLATDSQKELPFLDIPANFIAGLKVVLSGLVFVTVLILSIFALFALNSFLVKILGGFISIIFNILLFLLLFMFSFMFIAMCCRYVVKPSYLNFVNFKSAIKLINCDTTRYFKSFLLTVLCIVVVFLITMLSVSVLSEIGYIGLAIYCIIVSLLWTYQIFLFAGIFSGAVIPDKI